jgi:hypothetical protein
MLNSIWFGILKGDNYHPSIRGFREKAKKMPRNSIYPSPTDEKEEETIIPTKKPHWSRIHLPDTNYGTMTERVPRPEARSDPDNSLENQDYPNYGSSNKANAKHKIEVFYYHYKKNAGHDKETGKNQPYPSRETFELAGQPMSEDEWKGNKYAYRNKNRNYIWALEEVKSDSKHERKDGQKILDDYHPISRGRIEGGEHFYSWEGQFADMKRDRQ